MIAIIDYGIGNLRSVQRALELYHSNVVITNERITIKEAQALVLPGVGAFGDAVSELKDRGLFQVLKQQIRKKRTLAICLGMQLLFERSEENPEAEGLGVLFGEVKKLTPSGLIRIPHTGWNRLYPINEPYFSGFAYFNHTFYCKPDFPGVILAHTLHGRRIPAIIAKESILATQFHPEKSKETGKRILHYWVNLVQSQESKV
ncbi:MAG: imidazole glycerol phosphate synthase subunit HisH [Candidatus Hodarchaeota archaeon]